MVILIFLLAVSVGLNILLFIAFRKMRNLVNEITTEMYMKGQANAYREVLNSLNSMIASGHDEEHNESTDI